MGWEGSGSISAGMPILLFGLRNTFSNNGSRFGS